MNAARTVSLAVRLARSLTTSEARILACFARSDTLILKELLDRLDGSIDLSTEAISSLESQGLLAIHKSQQTSTTMVTITGLGECVRSQYQMWRDTDSLS